METLKWIGQCLRLSININSVSSLDDVALGIYVSKISFLFVGQLFSGLTV